MGIGINVHFYYTVHDSSSDFLLGRAGTAVEDEVSVNKIGVKSDIDKDGWRLTEAFRLYRPAAY